MTLTTHAGYSATMTDGVLTVHRVPIFVECERGEHKFSADWLKKAVAYAEQRARDGYFPPLHIRHHDDDSEVRASGFFRIVGTEPMTFKGKQKLAILADLVVTDPLTQDDILRKRLPYRSVEIFNVENPAIDSLALLDHEAPFLELPMLMVAGAPVEDRAYATLADPWSMQATPDTAKGACVASFRRGRRAALLFRESSAMDEPNKDDDEQKKPDVPEGGEDMAAEGEGDTGEDKGEDKPEPVAEKAPEAAPSLKDLMAALSAVLQLLQSTQAATAKAEPEPEPEPERPDPNEKNKAPAPSPATSMKNDDKDSDLRVKMAALSGEVEAGKMKLAKMEADSLREKEVASALDRLKDRPLGSDAREKFTAFHAEYGSKAFAAHIDAIAKNVAPTPRTPAPGFKANGEAPAVAMKYADKGPEAVAKATKAAAEWETLSTHRMTTLSQERYVELEMA